MSFIFEVQNLNHKLTFFLKVPADKMSRKKRPFKRLLIYQ